MARLTSVVIIRQRHPEFAQKSRSRRFLAARWYKNRASLRQMTQVSYDTAGASYDEHVEQHRSWAARIGRRFRSFFSVRGHPKQAANDEVEATTPWPSAFSRGPLGSTLVFKNHAALTNGSKESRDDVGR